MPPAAGLELLTSHGESQSSSSDEGDDGSPSTPAQPSYMRMLYPFAGSNIACLMNHGADATETNVVPVPVYTTVEDAMLPETAFFAERDIAPGEELLWYYGDDRAKKLEAVGEASDDEGEDDEGE